MSVDERRQQCISAAEDVGRVLQAVVVGMECSGTSAFDMQAAVDTIGNVPEDLIGAAMAVIAELFNKDGVEPRVVYDLIPEFVAEIALQDLE